MEFTENFASEAGELMDSILADSDAIPTITPFLFFGTNDSADERLDHAPSLGQMKRAGMYHAEAFEL